jgi:hypothetical protein
MTTMYPLWSIVVGGGMLIIVCGRHRRSDRAGGRGRPQGEVSGIWHCLSSR